MLVSGIMRCCGRTSKRSRWGLQEIKVGPGSNIQDGAIVHLASDRGSWGRGRPGFSQPSFVLARWGNLCFFGAMMRPLLLLAGTVLLSAGWVSAGDEEKRDASPASDSPKKTFHPYAEGPKTRDGIGKYYMGREIAQVMGHLAAGWLERPEREREEKPSLLMKNLELKTDAVIADVGAGSGYFTFRLAEKVPEGKVYAVDIQPEMIEILKKRKKALEVANVETILSVEDDTKLPENAVDAVLLVDAYHEFSFPREMLASMYRGLKPGGRIFLLEYRAEDPLVPIKPLHKMSQKQAKLEFAASGFRWLETRDFLPRQHFMIFERPKAAPDDESGDDGVQEETAPAKKNDSG